MGVDPREDPTHSPVRDVDATGQGLWESRGWLARWLPRATIGCSLAGTSPATVLGGLDARGHPHYKGNAQLFDELARRTDEVEQLIREVSGFVSYCLVRTADGGFSVSVFEDRAGTEESNRLAADWIRQNAPQVAGSPPEVIEGEAILQLSS